MQNSQIQNPNKINSTPTERNEHFVEQILDTPSDSESEEQGDFGVN